MTDAEVSWRHVTNDWILCDPFHWRTPDGTFLTIPAGFTFDLASIPRFLWSIPGYNAYELSVEAPLIHDFLYQHGGRVPVQYVRPYRRFTRRDADRFFRSEMKNRGVGWWRRNIAWLAVRMFGRLGWKRK